MFYIILHTLNVDDKKSTSYPKYSDNRLGQIHRMLVLAWPAVEEVQLLFSLPSSSSYSPYPFPRFPQAEPSRGLGFGELITDLDILAYEYLWLPYYIYICGALFLFSVVTQSCLT